MPSLTAITLLAGATCLSGVQAAARHIARQAPVLPSGEYYINTTRNDRTPVTLQIDTNNTAARNKTAPYLYGLMFEDINHSGDGGLYAEMIANRAFQGDCYRHIPSVIVCVDSLQDLPRTLVQYQDSVAGS